MVELMGFTNLMPPVLDCVVCVVLLSVERFWVPPLLCPEACSLFADPGELLVPARLLDILTGRNI
jgi:hypothetical protein